MSITEGIKTLVSIGYSEEEALQYIVGQSMINDEGAVLNNIAMKEREHYLKDHPYAISYIEDRRMYYTYVLRNGKRQKICRKSREELENELFLFYRKKRKEEKLTLRKIFPEWKEYRKGSGVADKTLVLYSYAWDRFYEKSSIADIPVTDLTPALIKRFYMDTALPRQYSRKRLADMYALMNGMLRYCVDMELLETNPAKDVDTKALPVKQKQNRAEEVYTEEEAEKILSYIEESPDDIYSLAIGLDFCLILRIGELKALRWEDINLNDKSVYIHTQVLESKEKPSIPENEILKTCTNNRRYYTHVSYVKKHSDTGTRMQYLNSRALSLIERIRNLSDSEYLFMKNGCFLITSTFNEKLEKICGELGIKYHSSHNIRFLNACKCFKNTGNLGLTQEVLGHSSSEMTFHYLSKNTGRSEMRNMFESL